jgi:hypothetical protein
MMSEIKIKDWYEHEHEKSIFIMFRESSEIVWSFSGNELRRIHLENLGKFCSEPIEVALPDYLYEKLSDDLDNF